MSGRSRFPFTAAQWKELEHKAPVFKYMISGTSIPPDLLFSIKRNSYDCREGGWSYSLLGMKKVDPEPGRCRRTDGKKWRCSKEAYANSKYCETHMHRGKNLSRKPVELDAINACNLLSLRFHLLSPQSPILVTHLLHPSFNHISPSSRSSTSPILNSWFY